ncbi:sigma-70 family RNA polymerase sigma factor [Nocardia sp. NPDC050710]|uniref:sigma-70 family RNA polymerase sigma factor n=1 Tax=Nocardia sp. NPDC050710 TaxID=3157220 RepID=UPI0033FF4CD9
MVSLVSPSRTRRNRWVCRPIPEAVTDAELVHRIGTGDREAYAQFYRRTHGMVFRRVLSIVRDHGYAEETCHEVYLQVWRSAANFDERRGSVLTWLSMLAHRQSVDRVRHERAAADHDHAWAVGDCGPSVDVVAEEVLRRHEYRSVRSGLVALTPLQRESVILAYYHGLTYPQVAEQLGIGLATVKSRIRAGLAQLESALAGDLV